MAIIIIDIITTQCSGVVPQVREDNTNTIVTIFPIECKVVGSYIIHIVCQDWISLHRLGCISIWQLDHFRSSRSRNQPILKTARIEVTCKCFAWICHLPYFQTSVILYTSIMTYNCQTVKISEPCVIIFEVWSKRIVITPDVRCSIPDITTKTCTVMIGWIYVEYMRPCCKINFWLS